MNTENSKGKRSARALEAEATCYRYSASRPRVGSRFLKWVLGKVHSL